MAFSLNPVMKKYLSMISDLNGKKVFRLLTQHFPFKWMGGSIALGQMNKSITLKSGAVTESFVVNWSNKKREEQIEDMITKISNVV